MSVELLTRQFADYHSDIKGILSTIDGRVGEVELQLARRPGDGGAFGSRREPASLGDAVTSADELKEFQGRGWQGSCRIVHERKAVTSASNSAGAAIGPDHRPEIAAMARRRPTIVNLLGRSATTSNSVEFSRQTGRTNNAATVAEAALKPESDLALTPVVAPVRTVAHHLTISRQAFEDAPLLADFINNELSFGLDMKLEQEVLFGDGTGQHLHGLIPQATAFAAPFAITDATPADIILQAIAQTQLSDLPATGIVLNSGDWAKMMALKATDGTYLGGGPWGMQQPMLWGLPVVATPSMGEGDFLVGNFQQAATLYERMATEVLISSEHSDYWVRNLLSIRAELRAAMAVKNPLALITGSFAA